MSEFKDHQVGLLLFDVTDNPQSSHYLSSNC